MNKPMDSNDTVQAWSALQLAIQGKAQAPLKEQAYIAALEKRYQPQHQDDRQALDKAFAAAMRQLARGISGRSRCPGALCRIPHEHHAVGLLDARSPAQARNGRDTFRLRFVMSRDPDHPGANHFYIPPSAGPAGTRTPLRGSVAELYAPAAGHLVHMPAHIYIRMESIF